MKELKNKLTAHGLWRSAGSP